MEHLARSRVEQVDPDLLLALLKQLQLESYLQSVATAALIYDTLITMDREVKYFWKAPRKAVDFVYFTNRYVGILGAIAYLFEFTHSADLQECNFARWTRDIANWSTAILTDYILTIRVLALYSKDRTMSICLYSCLALEAAAKLIIRVYMSISEKYAVGGAEGIAICGLDKYPPLWLGILDWSIPVVYGFVLMVLALYKAAEFWRLSSGFKGFTLVKVLIEDQVIYFMAVILVSVFAMLDFRLETSTEVVSAVLDILGNPTFLCILGSRMLLNLKEAGERGQNIGTSFVVPSSTVSDMEFGQTSGKCRSDSDGGGSHQGISLYPGRL